MNVSVRQNATRGGRGEGLEGRSGATSCSADARERFSLASFLSFLLAATDFWTFYVGAVDL